MGTDITEWIKEKREQQAEARSQYYQAEMAISGPAGRDWEPISFSPELQKWGRTSSTSDWAGTAGEPQSARGEGYKAGN